MLENTVLEQQYFAIRLPRSKGHRSHQSMQFCSRALRLATSGNGVLRVYTKKRARDRDTIFLLE